MAYFEKRGSIAIALLLIMVLCFATIAFLLMIGGRSGLTINQLKRAQAVYYAEAAIYESFNRIRAGLFTPATWNDPILGFREVRIGTAFPDDPNTGFDESRITVRVSFTPNAGGNPVPYRVTATVDYDDVRV
ncbi:MAG: hypothetical protein V2A72_03765 [Candidatus Omnitrophota bacterium]